MQLSTWRAVPVAMTDKSSRLVNTQTFSPFKHTKNKKLIDKKCNNHYFTHYFSDQIMQLKEDIERVAGQQPYMGEQMPIRWLRFEQELTEKADSGTNYASLNQVRHAHLCGGWGEIFIVQRGEVLVYT